MNCYIVYGKLIETERMGKSSKIMVKAKPLGYPKTIGRHAEDERDKRIYSKHYRKEFWYFA